MDWLGGLSNIKGQISNITKDLLSESTAELIDPQSELDAAKARIFELQSTVDTQKLEILSLKTKSDELEVRLESTQLRLDHARELFEKQILEKESIIQKLRAECSAERGEPEGQPSRSKSCTFPSGSPKSLILADHFSDELASEEYGNRTTDGSATWTELRNEVTHLRTSVAKWRKVARELKQKMENASGHSKDLLEMETDIEELRRKLAEAEENRQAEVLHLRQTHDERVTHLYGQLRDAESEIHYLRAQLENRVTPDPTSSSIVCTEVPEKKESFTEELQASKIAPKKKASRGKKKKSKTPDVDVADPAVSLAPVIQPPVRMEVAIQTETVDFPIGTCTTLDEEDSSQPKSQAASIQTDHVDQPVLDSAGVQVDLVCDRHSPISPTDHSSVAVQTTGHQSSASSAAESDPSLVILGSDDHHSQRSDVSDASSCAHQLDELVQQLVDEVGSYEQVIDQVVSALSPSITPTTTVPGETDVTFARNQCGDLTQKLGSFQASLRSRLGKLVSIRSANHRKQRASQRYLTGSPEPFNLLTGNSESNQFSMSRLETVTPAETVRVTEEEVNEWNDLEFPEIETQPFVPRLHATASPEKTISPGDAKSTQTRLSDSSETLVTDLRSTISELEERLNAETIRYQEHLLELTTSAQCGARLKLTLGNVVEELVKRLPQPVLSRFAPDPDWNRLSADPEYQLSLLIHAEEAAAAELEKTSASLCEAQELIARLQNRGTGSDSTGNVTVTPTDVEDVADISETDFLSLAHRLCTILDSEYTELNWDPDQWDALLFDLLKPRFTDPNPLDSQESSDDAVIRLSAEVTALRDILGQHTSFRAQAENDLRQLLATVTTQQEQIESLIQENNSLKETHGSSVEPTEEVPVSADAGSRGTPEALESLTHTLNRINELVRSLCKTIGLFEHEPPVLSDFNDEELAALFAQLSERWCEMQSRTAQIQSMYQSVLNALQQKHTESQNYHTELQRVYADLATSEKCNENLKRNVAELQTEIHQLQATLEKFSTSAASEPIVPSPVDATVSDDLGEGNSNSKEQMLLSELARLRSHLLEMEETYTTEALNAESREVQLRTQLTQVESRLQQLETAETTVEQRVAQAEAERNEARSVADEARKEVAVLRSNLANLQSVLNSFQQNQQSAVDSELDHIRLELRRVKEKESATVAESEVLKKQIKDQNESEQRILELGKQLQRYDSQLNRARAQLEQREEQISSLRTRLAQMAVDTDSKIDKLLIKNLLISYLQLPTPQRANGLRVIGNLLQFTEEEFVKIDSASGTLPKLFSWIRNAASALPSGPPEDVTLSSTYPDKSFTDLLLAFLEQESHPGTALRLSTEYYTPEAVRASSVLQRRQVSSYETDIPVTGAQSVIEALSSDVPQHGVSPSDIARPPSSSITPTARNPLFNL